MSGATGVTQAAATSRSSDGPDAAGSSTAAAAVEDAFELNDAALAAKAKAQLEAVEMQ